jgi:hypothetical protein
MKSAEYFGISEKILYGIPEGKPILHRNYLRKIYGDWYFSSDPSG